MNNVGLVLAGGGVKGSYQIGVWKALNELQISIAAVVGTSIGSVNGAMMTMGAYDVAEELWNKITINDIINVESQSENLFDLRNIMSIINEFYKNNGLDVSPFRSTIDSIIDENAVRQSVIDYGLVTYSLTDMKEQALFKNQIPEGKLVDYIMASACFPGFKTQKIDDKSFIDGAVNNNMPIDMLINKGLKDIIAVDVGGVGIVKNVDTSGINLFKIKCSENILGTLQFNRENIAKSIKMGYYDTYKTFGRLMGERYYFNTSDYYRAKAVYSQEILDGIEYAARVFNIDNLKVYKTEALIDGVIKGYRMAEQRYREIKDKFSNMFNVINDIQQFDEALILVWIVDKMKNNDINFLTHNPIAGILKNSLNAAGTLYYLISKDK